MVTAGKGGNAISCWVHLICRHLGMRIFECSLAWLRFRLNTIKLKGCVGHWHGPLICSLAHKLGFMLVREGPAFWDSTYIKFGSGFLELMGLGSSTVLNCNVFFRVSYLLQFAKGERLLYDIQTRLNHVNGFVLACNILGSLWVSRQAVFSPTASICSLVHSLSEQQTVEGSPLPYPHFTFWLSYSSYCRITT